MPATTREQNPLIGRRVRLIRCDDPYTKLKPGDEGTVSMVDDLGTVHVNWDNGSTLGMSELDGDKFQLLPERV